MLDVSFVITHFLELVKKLQSHCKGTAKDTAKLQTVENQALREILCSFAVYCKTHSQALPLPLARFLHTTLNISIHFSITAKLQKTKNKNKENH